MSRRRRAIDNIDQEEISFLERRPEGRSRKWEEQQRAGDPRIKQVSYRGIPVELRDGINAIAGELGTTASQVARVFLEYAVQDYRAGRLPIEKNPTKSKISLGSRKPGE